MANLLDKYKKLLEPVVGKLENAVSSAQNNLPTYKANLRQGFGNVAANVKTNLNDISQSNRLPQFQQRVADQASGQSNKFLSNFAKTGVNFATNRYLAPLAQTPEAVKNIFTPGKRIEGTIGLLGSVGAATPDPVFDVAYPAYEGLKGLTQSLRNKQGASGLLSGLSGEKYNQLGTAVSDNPIISKTLNAFELPALFLAPGAIKQVDNVFRPKGFKSNFKLDSFTMDELVTADEMLRYPEKYIGKISTGARTEKEALKIIQQQAAETIDRLAAKYLPDKQLNKLKTPQAIAKALTDLHYQNRLANVPGMGLVSGGETPQSNIIKKAETLLSDEALINRPQELNVQKLNLDKEGKSIVRNLESPEPKTTLSNDQIKEVAKTADINKRAKTMDQTAQTAAKDLATRQKVVIDTKKYFEMKQAGASQDQLEKQLLEIAKNSKVSREAGTDIARQLQARNILADEAATPMQKVFKLLDNAGVDQDKYIKDATKVNWENANSVVNFYRKYVPAKFSEILDEFRYTNMLSSPNTHINNTFGNFLQTAVVTPIEKTITGGLDWVKSTLTGSERKYFARQGIDYSKGYIKALPEAFANFKKAVTGELDITNLDLTDRVPTGSKGLMKAYSTPLRLLEASDQFFRTLVKGGEMESLKTTGITGEKALKAAEQSADYRLFRQKFDPNGELGQGGLLKVWDKWNSSINNLRNAPGGKWIVPFLSTPTNILKQGVEYSPVGLATIPGSKQPLEQLSKALVGSAVFATAYGLAESGLTTWDAPISEKDRQEFYAAGLQPYSIKMGDKWVSFSKLGPLSYPLAMAAAMKWYDDNGGSSDKLTNLGAGVGGFLQFFSDQSYMQGIGDLIDGLRGDEFKRDRAISNIPLQMVPYRALQGWFARIVDPVYRKAGGDGLIEKTTNAIKSQTPFLSKSLLAYEDPFGNQSLRQYPGINAVSPLKITKENTLAKQNFDKKIKTKVGEKRAKDQLEKTGSGVVQAGEKVYFYDDGGNIKSINRYFNEPVPKLGNSEELNKKILSSYSSKLTTRQNNVIKLYENGVISEAEAEKEILQLEEAKKIISDATKKPKKAKTPKIPEIKIPKVNISSNSPVKVRELRRRKFKKYNLTKVKKLTTSS